MASWRVLHRRVEDFKVWKGIKFSACLTDPPYHLQGGFMGADWDKGGIAFNPDTWRLLASHLLPGAFGMAFASARGWHRLACAIEDAGLRIHPSVFMLGYCYGSGFPKATRIDTQIVKAAGAERKQKRVATKRGNSARRGEGEQGSTYGDSHGGFRDESEPVTDLARAWAGHRYGLQALKPALESIIVFQKPYEGKAVDSITRTGAGALNIEGGRIGNEQLTAHGGGINKDRVYGAGKGIPAIEAGANPHSGRWPANFALQHDPRCRRIGVKKIKGTSLQGSVGQGSGKKSRVYGQASSVVTTAYSDADGLETIEEWKCVESCPVRRLDEQSGQSKSPKLGAVLKTQAHPGFEGKSFAIRARVSSTGVYAHGDSGGASRFFYNSDWNAEVEEGLLVADPAFYCAKVGKREREAGLDEEFPAQPVKSDSLTAGIERKNAKRSAASKSKALRRNVHPTLKPIKLCRWLATLLLPPAAYAPRRLLVPFSGAGSEMVGAIQAGWEEVLGIESEREYVEIAEARLRHWEAERRA